MPRRSPLPTAVCFVRHGTTPTTGRLLPGRAKGLHLAERGQEEAATTAERLSVLGKIAALYTSPLERTRETAAIIGRRIGQRPIVERGLIEFDFGDWTGKELAVLRKLPEWEVIQRHPSSFRFPNGESFVDVQARLSSALQRLVARHPGEIVVAVSHADPIKIALGDALGSPLDLVQRTVVSPCSVSIVSYGQLEPRVLTVNTFGDLTGLGLGPVKASRRR